MVDHGYSLPATGYQLPVISHQLPMSPIAHIESPFKDKFGIPRQAGLVDCTARIVFEPQYRVAEAVRGLEEFEYIWLIWLFHLASANPTQSTADCQQPAFKPTVRPPRLGGNKRVGVFATRSPFRPNAIGLSSVRLLQVEQSPTLGPLLHIAGADLVDGTPILDIKPYIPYADSHPLARSGFAHTPPTPLQGIVDDHGLLLLLPPADRHAVTQCLLQDPRPQYQNDANRVYAIRYSQWEIRFSVADEYVSVLQVIDSKNPKT